MISITSLFPAVKGSFLSLDPSLLTAVAVTVGVIVFTSFVATRIARVLIERP